jgi:hypothetical protein
LEANGFIGATEVDAKANVFPTGISAEGSVGTVEIDAKANVVVIGVFATGRVGKPLVWSIIDTAQTPDWQPILEAA